MRIHRFQIERRSLRGVTMVEAVIGTLIVAVMFISALQALAAANTMRFTAVQRIRAQELATSLAEEILQQQYRSPATTGATVPLFGVFDALDWSSGTIDRDRLNFDDVDDYRDYVDSPPTNRDGTRIPVPDGYVRAVSVVRVQPSDLARTTSTDMGVKRITVTVTHNGRLVARRVAVRTSWP